MLHNSFLEYLGKILIVIPWEHWICMVSFTLILVGLLQVMNRHSIYGAFALGITVFVTLFLVEITIMIRFFEFRPNGSGSRMAIGLSRFLHGGSFSRGEIISNLIAFAPFGFFLAEFLAETTNLTKRLSGLRRIGWVALAAFGLSLSIECLQLVLKVGYFELTDLVMNTLGGFVGALISTGLRKVVSYG